MSKSNEEESSEAMEIPNTNQNQPNEWRMNMNERIERIKQHFKRNKERYAYVTIGVVGTILVMVVKNRLGQIQSVTAIDTQVNTKVAHIKMETNYLDLGGRTGLPGRPGHPIRDVTDNVYYPSITNAAKRTGFNAQSIARNVNGKQKEVSGHQFVKVFVEAWHPGHLVNGSRIDDFGD